MQMTLSRDSRHIVDTVRRAIPDNVKSLLVAVSGGADSVALLRLLAMSNLNLTAVNCNFHLRGKESDRDSEYVRSLCLTLDVPLISLDFDVDAFRYGKNISTEMACRELRYDAFRRIKYENGCDRIAVAHHLDDNVETILLNLFRGTGINGLTGMRTDDGEIIRPLLKLRKSQILNFLENIGQGYVTDSTNLQSDFKRNFIRNRLIPLISTRWPGIIKAISRTQNNLDADARTLDFLLESYLSRFRDFIPYTELTAFPDPQTIVFRFIRPHGGTGTQAREIAAAILRHAYPITWLLEDTDVCLDRDGLSINTRTDNASADSHPFIQRKIIADHNTLREIRADRSNQTLYTSLPLTDISFRHPMPGDRIAPLGMKGTSLVNDILKDAGITIARRAGIWIATTHDGEIIWIEGIKRSRHFLLTPGQPGYAIYHDSF